MPKTSRSRSSSAKPDPTQVSLQLPQIFSCLPIGVSLLVLWATMEEIRDPCVLVPAGWLVGQLLLVAPYVAILWLLRGKHVRAGLALATAYGTAGAVLSFLATGATMDSLVSMTRTRSERFFAFGSPLLMLAQVGLAISAGRAYKKLAQQSDRVVKSFTAGPGAVCYLFLVVAITVGLGGPPRSLTSFHPFGPRGVATSAMRTILTAQVSYASMYPQKGFATTLAQLGPYSERGVPNENAADLLDSQLATGEKNYYQFTIVPGPADASGRVTTFALHARPLFPACRRESYYADQSNVIHYTEEDREAAADDPFL